MVSLICCDTLPCAYIYICGTIFKTVTIPRPQEPQASRAVWTFYFIDPTLEATASFLSQAVSHQNAMRHKTAIFRPAYGVPNVSKILTNAIFVYLPLIYKYDTDLAKYLPDLL